MNNQMNQKLERIESLQQELVAMLGSLIERKPEKEFYSTAEVAEILGKAEFTVREWARNGRIAATKKLTGYGRSKLWSISREELLRIQNEGLLPVLSR